MPGFARDGFLRLDLCQSSFAESGIGSVLWDAKEVEPDVSALEPVIPPYRLASFEGLSS